jgi:hypothetical protein
MRADTACAVQAHLDGSTFLVLVPDSEWGLILRRTPPPQTLRADFAGRFSRSTQFGRFLSGESRFDLWVRSHDDDATIVLDHYNLIYAYGPA